MNRLKLLLALVALLVSTLACATLFGDESYGGGRDDGDVVYIFARRAALERPCLAEQHFDGVQGAGLADIEPVLACALRPVAPVAPCIGAAGGKKDGQF